MNENAQAGLAAYREKVASGEIEVERKNPMQKHLENPKSLRLAINATCYECLGAGTPAEIRGCTAPKCPLFYVRPFQ